MPDPAITTNPTGRSRDALSAFVGRSWGSYVKLSRIATARLANIF